MNTASDKDTTGGLSRSFVYLVSPRGGNNYWAVVINGTDKLYDASLGTCAIFLSPNGRYTLMCDPNFFDKLTDLMKKMVLVHEAGHIAMRHPERLCKLLSTITDTHTRESFLAIYNIAADLAINDSIVRLEEGFDKVLASGEFKGWLPELVGFDKGLSMEQYMRLIVEKREEMKKILKELLKDAMPGDGEDDGEGDDDNDDESDSQDGEEGKEGKEGDGDGKPSSNGSGKPSKGSGGKSKKGGKKKKGEGDGNNEDEQASLAEALQAGLVDAIASDAAFDPDYYEALKKAHAAKAGNTHEQWNKIAGQLSPEEAISLAGKLKKHAKVLVKTARDVFKDRSRGFLPAHIQKMIDALLADEQVPWTWIFNDLIATHVTPKVIEEMAMPNLSLINDLNIEPWPGFALDHEFNIAWLTDTSGSVCDTEYARACVEFNALLKINKNIRVRYLECDAALQKEMIVDNLEVPDDETMAKQRTRKGYGGTVYTPAFKRLCGVDEITDWARPDARPIERPKPPDLLVVFTDGGVVIENEVLPRFHPKCPIIWLIAPNCHAVPGMNSVPPDHVIQMFHMKESED